MKENAAIQRERYFSQIKIGDDIRKIKQILCEKNLDYELRTKEESIDTRVDKFMGVSDKVVVSIYHSEKRTVTTEFYSVFFIFDENDLLKDIHYETFLLGP